MRKSSEIGVILPVCSPTQLERLDRSLLSFVGQIIKPDKIYVVCNDEVLETVKNLAISYQEYGLAAQVILSDSQELAGLLNSGLALATERYIAFLEDGDLLYSTAYQSLKEKMSSKEAVGISFAEVSWFNSEVYNEMDYKTGRGTRLVLHKKSWLEYYAQCAFLNCLFDRTYCKASEWQFDSELPESVVFADFLARNGYLVTKNIENYNIPVGEKWNAQEKKVKPILHELGEAYHQKWDEVIHEKDFQNFSTKRRKKKKVRLWEKALHTCRYLKYRLQKG